MIDPTNTEPIPVHAPHRHRTLAVLAVLILLGIALFSIFKNMYVGEKDIPLIPPPTPGSTASFLSNDDQAQIALVQERMHKGELTQADGMKLIDAIVAASMNKK